MSKTQTNPSSFTLEGHSFKLYTSTTNKECESNLSRSYISCPINTSYTKLLGIKFLARLCCTNILNQYFKLKCMGKICIKRKKKHNEFTCKPTFSCKQISIQYTLFPCITPFYMYEIYSLIFRFPQKKILHVLGGYRLQQTFTWHLRLFRHSVTQLSEGQ